MGFVPRVLLKACGLQLLYHAMLLFNDSLTISLNNMLDSQWFVPGLRPSSSAMDDDN